MAVGTPSAVHGSLPKFSTGLLLGNFLSFRQTQGKPFGEIMILSNMKSVERERRDEREREERRETRDRYMIKISLYTYTSVQLSLFNYK